MTSVSIIGSGSMARGIATRALACGHAVQIFDRELAKATALAGALKTDASASVTAGMIGDPLTGEIVVLAVPYAAAVPLVRQNADQLAGKVIVDITNPVDWVTFDGLVTPPGSSAAEEIAEAAPADTPIVKAFNTTFAGTLVSGQVGNQPLDVFLAGDDPAAKTAVGAFIESIGLRAIDTGVLDRARYLEGLGFLHITLQKTLGTNFRSTVKIVA